MPSTRSPGSQGSYRRARHLVAFASAPLALSMLLVWPLGIAAFGGDVFRSGGADSGTGGTLFYVVAFAFAAWSIALVGVGIRAVHGWTWPRAGLAVAIALGVPVLIGVAVGVT